MVLRIVALILVVLGVAVFLNTRGVFYPRVAAGGATIVMPDKIQAKKETGHPIILRIVGTSLTTRGDWTKVLEQALNACSTKTIVVDRVAKAGGSSTFAVAHLDRILGRADLMPPDYVAIEFSGNDASLYHGMPLSRSRQIHKDLVDTLRANGIGVALATMSPAFGWKALERPGQDAYHGIYRELSTAEPVILIDTIAAWRALPEEVRERYLPDNLHPTPEAMEKIIVPAFLKAMTPILCS